MNPVPGIRHWRPVTHPPDLAPGGLHLWKIRIGHDGAPLATQWSLLSQRELDRARRFRFDRHRERYVRAGAGLRRILSGYMDMDPGAILFEYGSAGKPRLAGSGSGMGFDFNLTTSGDLALVAISADDSVGVDCEQIRDCQDAVAIAERMFSPRDAARIAAAVPEHRLECFFVGWTALEARVKADGRGLPGRKEPLAGDELQILHCIPDPGFIAAVARTSLPPVEEWAALESTDK